MKSNISINTDKEDCYYVAHVSYVVGNLTYYAMAYGESKARAEAKALSRLGEDLKKENFDGR